MNKSSFKNKSKKKTKKPKMGPPTPESLAGMGLLGKKDSIITEVVYLRDDAKRTDC